MVAVTLAMQATPPGDARAAVAELLAPAAGQGRPQRAVVVQVGGHTGLLAMGPSWSGRNGSRLVALIGYLPRRLGGVALWQITARADWYPLGPWPFALRGLQLEWLPLSVALGATYGIHRRLVLWHPQNAKHQRWYYLPTAARAIFALASTVRHGAVSTTVGWAWFDLEVFAYVDSNGLLRRAGPLAGLSSMGSLGVSFQCRL